MNCEQLAEQTRRKFKYALLALIGLILSPLAIAHASSPPADSVHFCAPFDYEQWRRDYPRPAAKRLADLNVGEPRTVRMIYFLPKDKPYRQEVVDAMKAVIGRVQTFYAEQMQTHGYGNLTFRFETDDQGEPVVHRLDGKHPASHYTEGPMDEIAEVFDLHRNIYSIVAENDGPSIGAGERLGKNGGAAWLDEAYTEHGETWYTANKAHEIGHAFGLWHDFRDDTYIMSYGYGDLDYRLSASAAEFLSVHPYFNPAIPIEAGQPPTVELISPTRYPAGSQSVSIRLKVSDPTGIHQVCLQTIAFVGLTWEVTACQGVSGKTDAVVEFDYDGVIPSSSWWWSPQTSLSNPPVHEILIMAIDKAGNAEGTVSRYETMWEFTLVEKSPNEIASLEAYSRSVHSLALSPDGALLAFLYGRDDPTVRLWDVATQKTLATLDHGQSVAFSPDGTLAIGSQRDTRLWDVATRKQVAMLDIDRATSLAFSPDGSLLAAANEAVIRLWDVATRKQVAMLDIDRATSLAFSPDGTTLAFVSEAPYRTIQLWDVATQKPLATLDHGQLQPTSLAFSPDGTTLATGHLAWHRTVALWDVETWEQVAVLERQGTVNVTSVAFSPDGALLASAGGAFNTTVRLWDVRTRQEIVSFGHTDPLFSVAFSLDGATLAAGSEEAIILWDVSEWIGDQAVVAVGEQELDGEIADDESSSEDQPTSGGQPATAVELKSISSSHDSVRENDGQATTITLTVTLDKTAATDETITLTLVSPLVGKTAKRGEDFDAILAETLTIAKGQRTGTAQLVLTPKDNTTAEGDKAFAVQATSSSGHAALINIKIIDNDAADEPQARLTPDPAAVAFSADDPAWKTFTVHTNLDSVLVRANPAGFDPALEVAGGQQAPTRDYCPAEGNDRPTRGRRDGWNLHVKACQAGQTKILLIDYDTGAVVQEYEVTVEASTSAAATTRLNPSYPNPFNSETILSYTLSTASAIRLEVFTLNGQRVAVLHEGFQAAGYHTIAMDASDLASGVYLYRLTTPEGRFVQKFTLLR